MTIITPDRATAYAEKVVIGDVVAGKPHIQACKRHLRDLERQGTSDFPYLWEPGRSEEIIDFAETLTIIEGYEPKPVKLYGCQQFDLGVPMGWLNRERYRRFRRKYKSVARQNGKTFENGITGTYIAGFSGYRYSKLFTVATKKRQGRLAWEEMAKFIMGDDELLDCFLIQDYKSLITSLNSRCTIEALSKEAGLEEGFRSIYASVDEVHQHRDNSIYTTMYRGQRSLPETLLSMITTRGTNLNTFCYEMDRYCLSILDGGSTAEDFFVDIYTLDEKDNIFDPACFIKSNPVLCQTEHGMRTMLTDAQTAKDMGGQEQVDFMVKCQNMWVQNSENQFIDPVTLEKCRVAKKLEQFRGQSAYAGIDLSSGGDLTTLGLEFEDEHGFYTWSLSFMPRGRIEEHKKTDVAPYDLWEQKRLIIVTGGESDFKNDYGFIVSELKRISEELEISILGIGYDPHNADGFLKDLEQFGCPLLEIRQSARFLSDGTQDIQILMKSGKYHYDQDNELLDWSFRSAKVTRNSFGEKKVDKDPKAKNKRIDPVDTAINAHIARMKLSGVETVDLGKIMQDYLDKMGWNGKEGK